MTKNEITQILTNRYNRNDWKIFLNNLFLSTNIFEEPEVLTDIVADFVFKVSKIGFINVNENTIIRNIGIFEVELGEGVVLEKNRVGLRNLLRKYWKDLDGAFIVYFRDSYKSWRFTYVSELTGIDDEGNYKDIKTDPKRYTYIFGEGESCKTAVERFLILHNKKNNISLDDIKDAFSVEKLSKSFFADYKKHYVLFCNYLTNTQGIFKSIFNGDEKEVRDFVKLLLGRIIFLYFIQKKGWLGVPVNGNWGDGDNNFLSNLFNKYKYKQLFYQNILAKLFFDTLNTSREDDIIELIEGEKIKIPFLNGGLFEEHEPKYRNIVFEEALFQNLFDFFDMYNFTIYEDDPNDHTVAVDPEMLGHIFENLLEDNKDKGAYYTPKEIVHYMCRESLIEYLATWFEKNDYLVIGNNFDENGNIIKNVTNRKSINKTLLENLLKKKLKASDEECLIKYYEQINTALDKVKICDPAIGSGAFPMGLLQEIYSVKQTLWYIKNGNLNNFPASEIKLNIIQNSIYGVDIEKGAVDIARLRFWLSLIVDEEAPKPLPNLDYKIVVGNSLVSKFGDDIIDIDWDIDVTAYGYIGHELAIKTKELLELIITKQKEYFSPLSNKKTLSLEIRNLKIDLLINHLELMLNTSHIVKKKGTCTKKNRHNDLYIQQLSWADSIKRLKRLKKEPSSPLNFFDWKLDFPEIFNPQFNHNPGFDLVIANPPYIDSETMVGLGFESIRTYLSSKFPFCKGNWDIYIAFFNLGYTLMNNNGIIAYITPDKWLSKPFGFELRTKLKYNFKLISEAGRTVFQNAKIDSIISFISQKQHNFLQIDKFYKDKSLRIALIDKLMLDNSCTLDWLFSDNLTILRKIENLTNRLSSICTCENACATSDAYKLKKLIKNSEFNPNLHLKVINTGTINKYVDKWGLREMTYLDDKYLFPVVDKATFLQEFANSYGNRALMPKIIIKGLTLLHGCIDIRGQIIPGKSTLIISKAENKLNDLYFLLALINCNLTFFYIKEKYRGSSYNQGINFKPEMVNNLPIPDFKERFINKIISLVKCLLELIDKGASTFFLETQINMLIYQSYKLNYKEVKVIDPDFPITEEEYTNFKFD
jgi:hypothetical protein